MEHLAPSPSTTTAALEAAGDGRTVSMPTLDSKHDRRFKIDSSAF
jgi:hypothetical protein